MQMQGVGDRRGFSHQVREEEGLVMRMTDRWGEGIRTRERMNERR